MTARRRPNLKVDSEIRKHTRTANNKDSITNADNMHIPTHTQETEISGLRPQATIKVLAKVLGINGVLYTQRSKSWKRGCPSQMA